VSRAAPRAPVCVGFIGAGNVLPAYLQVLDRLVPRGLAVEGPICARQRGSWPALRARRPHAQLVGSPEEVLESPADVVVVLTPPASHAELTHLALEAGKHVVVEKPFASTRREGEILVGLARERGLNLLAAPFVHLAPTFRVLWTLLRGGAIGSIHTARGLYGNAGSHWATWYHASGVGPLAEVGIYNLKSLTALLGPVVEVVAAEARAVDRRVVGTAAVETPDPDVSHLVLRHDSGALSSVVSSQAIQRYRRPALELYGTDGTANLLGDDWDPRGFEIWRNEAGSWEAHEAVDGSWLWADGLREAVLALAEGRPPLADNDHDLHLLDVVDAARRAAADGRAMHVSSAFGPLDLTLGLPTGVQHLHDHTRPPEEQ
jgi:predicted dehydrogenase